MAKKVPGVPADHPSQPAVKARARIQWEKKVDFEAFAMKQSRRRSALAAEEGRDDDLAIERRRQDRILDTLVELGALGRGCG